MKKLLYFIFTGILLFSIQCSDDPIKSDHRFETKIKTVPSVSGFICANIPTELNISLLSDNEETGNYLFSFTSPEGEGKLYINNTHIPENDTIALTDSEFKAYYIPETLGEHRLKLIFSNKDFCQETIYSISVDKYSMDITDANAEEMYLNREINLYFRFSAENDTSEYFKANISIAKGEGKLTPTAATPDADSTVINTRSNNPHSIKKGLNHIQYIPHNTGEHILLLSVTNTYGYTQDFELSFNVDYPEYQVNTSIADSCINIYSQAHFAIRISGSEENYPASFRFLRNTGNITINGKTPAPKQKFNLPSGMSKGYITADSTGESIIEFTVTDQYNRILKDTVHFTVIPTHTDIIIRDFDTIPVTGKESFFKIDVINENGYAEGYNMTIDGAGAEIKVNGNTTGKEDKITFFKTISASYTPAYSGKNTLTIQITDNKNQTIRRDLSYTAIQPYREISVKDYNPLIKYGEKKRIYFDILSNTGETFTCKLLSTAAGDITLNGHSCTEGCPAAENNYFDFIPSLTGETVITIEITSNTGHIITKDVTFSVSTTETNISVTGFQNGNPNIKTSIPIYASFSVSKPASTGTFKCRFSGNPAGNTVYKINGENYTEGEELLLPFNKNIPAALSFRRPGKQEISLNIRDDEGIDENIKFEYTVTESPLTLDIKEFFPNSQPGVKNTAYLSIDKKDYNGNFQLLIETENDTPAGTFKINGEDYQPGDKKSVTGKNDVKISFLPLKPGRTNITVTVSDDNGNQVSESLSYDIPNPELQLTVTPPAKTVAGQEASIRFSVAKSHYTGKYLAEVTGTDSPFQLNGKEYNGGKTEILPGNNDIRLTPFQACNLYLKIYDEWGSSAERNIEITPAAPTMELTVHTPSPDIRESTNFIVTASHENGSDMTFSLKTQPTAAGKFYINSEEYTGERKISSGTSVNVVFKPSTTGKITVTVGLDDKTTGIHREKQIQFNSLETAAPSDDAEILTLPVEYVLTKATALINDSSYFETYIGDIHFLGHDGEGRITDYETVFSNTEHITVPSNQSSGSINLGNATFPVYVYEGSTPVDDQKQGHIFLRVNNVSPIFLKYDKAGEVKINWGYKFIHTVTHSTVLDIKSSSQCYLRNCSSPYPEANYPAFYQFHPINDNLYSCKPLADDIRDCKIVVYCDIEPAPYKINTEKKYTVQENQPATFKFSYSSQGGDIKRAKVQIYKSSTSSGDFSDLKVNGITLKEGVYLAPDEEATVTFIPQGKFHLSISLTEGENSIISDHILFISQ